jgi:hypothetical protein
MPRRHRAAAVCLCITLLITLTAQQALAAQAAAHQDSLSVGSLLVRPEEAADGHAVQRQLPRPFLYPADEHPSASIATAGDEGGRQALRGRASGSSSSSQQGQSLRAAAGALDGLLVPPASGNAANPVKAGGYYPEQTETGNLGQGSKGGKQDKGKDKDKGPQDGFTGGRPPHVPVCDSIPGCQYCPYHGRCQQCLYDGFAKFVRNSKGRCGELQWHASLHCLLVV